jgi:SAM-dependent methyltransferase
MSSLRQKQTLASFDWQWRELPEGGALLTEPWFREHVDSIISEELLCVSRDWFPGRAVLDAGCGNGRWTIGLLRLGCRVCSVDASEAALGHLQAAVDELCTPEERERLEVEHVNLLELPAGLRERDFDLVFTFGVLHHTGNTRQALRNVAALAGPEGMLFAYLYGRGSVSRKQSATLELVRIALAPLPFSVKRKVISRLSRGGDTHQAFDCLSPTINTRHTFEEVGAWLAEDGFGDVDETIPHTELFVRALRDPGAIGPFLLPKPEPPYWFERYA